MCNIKTNDCAVNHFVAGELLVISPVKYDNNIGAEEEAGAHGDLCRHLRPGLQGAATSH